jgi:hypothetical protein
MIFPYDHMSKIWNQTEYCPDGKIIEMVKDGEYLEDDNLESVGTP